MKLMIIYNDRLGIRFLHWFLIVFILVINKLFDFFINLILFNEGALRHVIILLSIIILILFNFDHVAGTCLRLEIIYLFIISFCKCETILWACIINNLLACFWLLSNHVACLWTCIFECNVLSYHVAPLWNCVVILIYI